MSEANLEQETVDEVVSEVEPEVETLQETAELEQTEAEVVEADRVRAIAEAQGWRPDGKLNPVDFLEAIPKYSEGLVSKLRAAEDKIDRLTKAVGSQISAANERAKAEAEQRLRDAVERGDTSAAMEAAAEVHRPQPTLDETPTDTQTKLKQWTERPEQAWFRTDPDAAHDAAAFYNAEAAKLGRDDPDVILPLVTAKIKKLYPEKFTNPNRQQGSATPASTAARTTQPARKGVDLAALGLAQPVIQQYRALGLTDAEIAESMRTTKRVY